MDKVVGLSEIFDLNRYSSYQSSSYRKLTAYSVFLEELINKSFISIINEKKERKKRNKAKPLCHRIIRTRMYSKRCTAWNRPINVWGNYGVRSRIQCLCLLYYEPMLAAIWFCDSLICSKERRIVFEPCNISIWCRADFTLQYGFCSLCKLMQTQV